MAICLIKGLTKLLILDEMLRYNPPPKFGAVEFISVCSAKVAYLFILHVI